MAKRVMRQVAADYLAIHWAKLDRLRKTGLIPEAEPVGNIWVYPVDRLEAIKARLLEQGHIKSQKSVEVASGAS